MLKVSFEEIETIKNIIYGFFKMQPRTIDELVKTVFSEPYSFDSGFGLKSALEIIAKALNDLNSQHILNPVFEEDFGKITIEIKWSVK